MQSTWENLVDYDMSESGVRPLTLRELVEMGFDLDAFLDQPLGYSQSNGTIELRERLAAHLSGRDVEQIEVTNGTSEANYLVALSQLRPGDEVAMEVPNYMQMPGVARSLGATVRTFSLRQDTGWEPDWDEFERAVTPQTRLLYLSNPNNPTGLVLSRERDGADRRALRVDRHVAPRRRGLSRRRDRPAAHDELLGHERPRHRDERPVEGVRHPGRARRLDRRPAAASSPTAGRSTTTSRSARTRCPTASRASPSSRRTASAATRARAPSSATTCRSRASGSRSFGGRLTWREPQAGAIALVQVRRRRRRASRSPSACASTRARSSSPDRTSASRATCGSGSAAGRSSCAKGLRRIGSELTPLFD